MLTIASTHRKHRVEPQGDAAEGQLAFVNRGNRPTPVARRGSLRDRACPPAGGRLNGHLRSPYAGFHRGG